MTPEERAQLKAKALDYRGGMAAECLAVLDALERAEARTIELESALKEEMAWDMGGVPENECKRRAENAEAELAALREAATEYQRLVNAPPALVEDEHNVWLEQWREAEQKLDAALTTFREQGEA